MAANAKHRRRLWIAGFASLAVAVSAYGLVRFYPALGPIAGTVTPQLYVDSLPNAQIPRQGPYILVDAASARLYMMEDGHVKGSMRVIVGKPETPTPELHDVINYATVNPYWHVTPDMGRTLIAVRVLQDGKSYLTDRGYEIVSGWGSKSPLISPDTINWKAVADGTQQIYVRQRPGPANSLGRFKFDLPHGDGIYLHDTPKKELFAQDQRALSHGCVRLEDAQRLATWMLGRDPPPPAPSEEHILLPHPVPITISYLNSRDQLQLAALQ